VTLLAFFAWRRRPAPTLLTLESRSPSIRAFCFAVPSFVPCTIGGAAVFDSTVTDTLPPSVQFVSASASGAFAPVTCGERAPSRATPKPTAKARFKG
jgi:hypothetical protein